jgi:hypothetical protein
MMNKIIGLILISILMMVAAPAWSGSAVAVYSCEQGDDASEADVLAAVADWLKAAKAMKGGENIDAFAMFPMAATMGEYDWMFIVTAPSFAEWGAFMDGYEGSAAAEADKKYADVAICPDSALWESFRVESK